MSELSDLVRVRMRERGWSYAELARRAGLPRSTVHHLATQERFRRMPEDSTLLALARGLDLPLPAVRRAAATAAGILARSEPAEAPEVTSLIENLRTLTADEQRHVAALVDSLLREHSHQQT